MFFLNLSVGQFLALFGSASAVVVALYLFDRSRRRQVVATLRFWVAAEHPVEAIRRRSIQQKLSLFLQLLSIALLLLAICQPRLGSRDSTPYDHVLLLDTSAWMGARAPRGGHTLMDEARSRARAYVRALPAEDRVMLVRADALASAATAFEAGRQKLEDAIAASRPGSTALNLEQAFDYARQVLALSARRPGEIVFVGSGRIADREASGVSIRAPRNLRVLPVADAVENVGLRKLGLRKSPSNPALWEIFVSARNYGARTQNVNLVLLFGGAPAGSRRLTLAPGAEEEATFHYRTKAAGLLEARLLVHDAFPDDDRVVLELPEQRFLSVVVYSDTPDALRPVLEADPRVTAVFRSPKQYTPKPEASLMILDRFRPPAPPQVDALWIDPEAGSPIPVRARAAGVRLTQWNTNHPLGAGLRTRDVVLESATVFEAAPGDIRIAECESGPVVVARPSKPKIVVFGFHPARTAMRYELATPVLFANVFHWVAPDVFRRWEINGGSAGTVNAPLEQKVKPDEVRIVHQDGRTLPHTVRDRSLRFFSGAPGTVRVTAGDRETVFSLTLPEVGETRWEAPGSARQGLPHRLAGAAAAVDLWPYLALAGAAGLLMEWILYGRFARAARMPPIRVLSWLRFRHRSTLGARGQR